MANKSKKTVKVFCTEDYAEDFLTALEAHESDVINKDVSKGDILDIIKFDVEQYPLVKATTNLGLIFTIDLNKERSLFSIFNSDFETFRQVLELYNEDSSALDISLMVEDEGDFKGSILKAFKVRSYDILKKEIKSPTSAFPAKIISKNQGGFFAEIYGVKCFMPGSLAAANKIINFGEFVGKTVNVMIEDWMEASKMFIVSHKKYLETVIPFKIKELPRNVKMKGLVTGSSKLGVFAEFEEMFTGLLHVYEMNEDSAKKHENRYFKPGMEIEVWFKEVKDDKLVLSDFDPNIKIEENKKVKAELEGNTFKGKIKNFKDFGAFIEFDGDRNGLLPLKEYKNTSIGTEGSEIEVVVKRFEEESGKIYLTLKK